MYIVYSILVLPSRKSLATTSMAEWLRACDLGHDEAMEVGGREFSLHGRVVKGV